MSIGSCKAAAVLMEGTDFHTDVKMVDRTRPCHHRCCSFLPTLVGNCSNLNSGMLMSYRNPHVLTAFQLHKCNLFRAQLLQKLSHYPQCFSQSLLKINTCLILETIFQYISLLQDNTQPRKIVFNFFFFSLKQHWLRISFSFSLLWSFSWAECPLHRSAWFILTQLHVFTPTSCPAVKGWRLNGIPVVLIRKERVLLFTVSTYSYCIQLVYGSNWRPLSKLLKTHNVFIQQIVSPASSE